MPAPALVIVRPLAGIARAPERTSDPLWVSIVMSPGVMADESAESKAVDSDESSATTE